jgi:integrase
MGKKKQKGNGTGTVYPRKNKDGKVIGYRSSYFAPDGKRRYLSAKQKGECEKLLREAITDADRGLVFEAGTLTLGRYLDKWLSGIKDTVRQRSWERYEQLVRVHIKPALGSLKLKDLTRAHVKNLYGEKLDAGSSPRTVQYIHTTMHKALKDAMIDGLIPKNVSAHIRLPKPRKKEINPLNPEQAKTFLEAARGDRYEALYVLAVHCGLRQGELLGLKWSDVDLDGGVLQVRRTMSEARSGRIEEQPKNGKGRRIDLTRSVSEALRRHQERQREEIKGTEDYQDFGLIFASTVGTPTNSKNLYWRSYKPTLERAGLPDISFHELRHTCATIRFMRGQHPKRVQELLGHASIVQTMDTYSHVIPGMGDDDVMEEVLG